MFKDCLASFFFNPKTIFFSLEIAKLIEFIRQKNKSFM